MSQRNFTAKSAGPVPKAGGKSAARKTSSQAKGTASVQQSQKPAADKS